MTDKQEKNQSKFTNTYASCKHGKDPGILTCKMAEAITLNISLQLKINNVGGGDSVKEVTRKSSVNTGKTVTQS